jgi:diguanylate cyclase (GGDEF)-like protein
LAVRPLSARTTLAPSGGGAAATLAAFGGQASVAIENVLLHQETEQMSITDGLTGVWNRRYLELSLRKEIERAHRFSRPLSLLMVDIDRFKRINDQFGHQRGDEVLVEVTRRIMGTVRTQIDFMARYGGEEFVVVLPETPAPGAAVVAEKVRAAIGGERCEPRDPCILHTAARLLEFHRGSDPCDLSTQGAPEHHFPALYVDPPSAQSLPA